MSKPFCSICVLSYQRPDFLKRSLDSLINTPSGFPMEILVNDDGSQSETQNLIYKYLRAGKISYAIFNGGQNMGIGKSIHNCFDISSGNYLFKADADLEYTPGWLKKAVDILQFSNVGCIGLFDYRHYDPKDERFNIIGRAGKSHYFVDDFVSSIYGVRREMYERYGKCLGHDGWHQSIKQKGYSLAIPQQDLITNFGFGANTSIFVTTDADGKLTARGYSEKPKIFDSK